MSAIAIDLITSGTRLRSLREEAVASLAESIAAVGLLQPITVRRQDRLPEGGASFQESYTLIAGLHRLEACRRLGLVEIEANVVTLGEAERQIWEIDENLCRADLTELERGEHLAKRKEIYEWWHPETRRGVSGALAMHKKDATAESAAASFVADTAAKTGIADRTIRQSIHRVKQIDEKVRDRIRAIQEIADSGVELDALAAMGAPDQRKAVALVEAGQAAGIREAKKIIEPAAPKPKRQSKSFEDDWWDKFEKLIAKANDELRQRAREFLDEAVADNTRALKVVK